MRRLMNINLPLMKIAIWAQANEYLLCFNQK